MEAGVVDQYVDAALQRGGLSHDLGHARLVGNITLQSGRQPRIAANLRRRRLCRRAIDIDQHDMRALTRQRLAKPLAKTAAATGDNRGFACPIACHDYVLSRLHPQ